MANPLPLAHVAFIMDGNGRWAKARGLPRLEGHRKGAEALRHIVEAGSKLGLQAMTFYAFSSENWKRPEQEVRGLFDLMRHSFKNQKNQLEKQNVRIRFIGDRSTNGRLPQDILTLMNDVEHRTAHNTGPVCTFAINYGGRDELVRAAQTLQNQGAAITEETLATALDTAALPEVDLIIRTAGEQRLSNFLLWQAAYAEFMFVSEPWPDFTPEHLTQAIAAFASRTRRFGGLPQ